MHQLYIYENLKAFMYTFPSCLLDNILCIEDAGSNDPFTRYKDFQNQFYKHFTSNIYGAGIPADKTMFKLPHISLEIIPRRSPNGCEDLYTVSFIVDFQTISPADCENGCPCVPASSAGILGFVDAVAQGINEMMADGYVFHLLQDSTSVRDEFKNNSGRFKFNTLITSISSFLMSPVATSNEIHSFAIDYDITIGGTYSECSA